MSAVGDASVATTVETLEGLATAKILAICIIVSLVIIMLIIGPVVTELLVNKKNKDLQRHAKGINLVSNPTGSPSEMPSTVKTSETIKKNKRKKQKKKTAI